MVKLSKEEIQKVVLSTVLVVILLFAYRALLIGPLNRQAANAEEIIADLEPKIREAKAQLRKTAEMEAKAPEAAELRARVEALIPQGEPVAWFPPRMADFFRRQGIERVTVRLDGGGGGPSGAEGYAKLSWQFEIPDVSFFALGIAVAGLENEEPLVEIQSLSIEPSAQGVRDQKAAFTATSVVRK